MSIKLTMPQATLLGDLARAGDKGVLKDKRYGPAMCLVDRKMATWKHTYNNGATGLLVITETGRDFRDGCRHESAF